MENRYGIDWDTIKGRYDDWWHHCNTSRPLLTIRAPKVRGQLAAALQGYEDGYHATHQPDSAGKVDYADYWLNIDEVIRRNEAVFDASYYTAETYPKLFASLGVTSHAVFLGGTPLFSKDTIWCDHAFQDPEADTVSFDSQNKWYRWSLEATKRIAAHANGSYRIGIPDLCENTDVMASLYETQDLLFHLYDYEDEILAMTREVQRHWFPVYDAHRELVLEPDGYCNYGPFQLFGKGRIAKLQCDMSAMIGQDMFETFALPFLREQTEWLDSSVYHLDGPDAVKHLDAVLTMDKLSALQWTPGAGNADGGDECWDFIYEKALSAGKSIYALVAPHNIPRFVKRFGHKGVLIVTAAEDKASADEIVEMIR